MMSLVPFMVTLNESRLRHSAHNVNMPESVGKVNPFLVAVITGRAFKKSINVWLDPVEQGNNVILQRYLEYITD